MLPLIWVNRFHKKELEKGEEIDDILLKFRERPWNLFMYNREIYSTIEWQDRSSMIWIREVIQNSRDAILKAKKQWKKVDEKIKIDFYKTNWQFTSSVHDNIWMTEEEVLNTYLHLENQEKEYENEFECLDNDSIH